MSEEFYLKPFDFSFDKLGNINFHGVKILRAISKNRFEIEKILSKCNKTKDHKSDINPENYLNFVDRLKKINTTFKQLNIFGYHKPIIMGILNITKDSFYDGGRYFDPKDALSKAEDLLKEGANIIDVGGESTRPGAKVIDIDEEIKRIKPVIEELSKNNILVSCDTRNSKTMQVALDLGAKIINDVSGLSYDKNTLKVLKNYDCMYILMHSRGTPKTMQNNPIYNHVVCDIYNFFKKKLMALKRMDISENRIILDPGIGYSKTLEQNYNILQNLGIFLDLGHPLMIGLSRKSLIRKLVKSDSLTPSVVLAVDAFAKGARIIRVHDVQETKEAIEIFKKAN